MASSLLQQDDSYNECVANLSKNENISLELREKICKIINGIPIDEDEPVQDSFKDLINLWFNDPMLIDAIYETLRQSGLRITPEITCSAYVEVSPSRSTWIRTKNNIQYNYFSGSHTETDPVSGLPRNVRTSLDFNVFLESTQINDFALSGELFAIPIKFAGSYITGTHENTIICQITHRDKASNKLVLECELFEPHGKYFLGGQEKYKELNDFIRSRALDIIYSLFDETYEIIIFYPDQICPLDEKKVLQGLTREPWRGTCVVFPMWYVFLRLLNPSRSRADTYHLMNNFLQSSHSVNEVVRLIVLTFTSLVRVNLADFTINERPSFLEATKQKVQADASYTKKRLPTARPREEEPQVLPKLQLGPEFTKPESFFGKALKYVPNLNPFAQKAPSKIMSEQVEEQAFKKPATKVNKIGDFYEMTTLDNRQQPLVVEPSAVTGQFVRRSNNRTQPSGLSQPYGRDSTGRLVRPPPPRFFRNPKTGRLVKKNGGRKQTQRRRKTIIKKGTNNNNKIKNKSTKCNKKILFLT